MFTNFFLIFYISILKIKLSINTEHIEKLFYWLFCKTNKNFVIMFHPTNNNNFYVEQLDLVLHSNKSSIDLIITCFISIGLISFLLFQARLLNLSFYPNATFDSEKYSPYECGFSPFKTE
jgi:hypothetical protein